MFRIWGKIWKDNHLLRDYVYEDSTDDTRTHKVFAGIEKMTYEFDLPKPIWLEKNINEFKRSSCTRFNKDSFIEEIDFDYFEVLIIEED